MSKAQAILSEALSRPGGAVKAKVGSATVRIWSIGADPARRLQIPLDDTDRLDERVCALFSGHVAVMSIVDCSGIGPDDIGLRFGGGHNGCLESLAMSED